MSTSNPEFVVELESITSYFDKIQFKSKYLKLYEIPEFYACSEEFTEQISEETVADIEEMAKSKNSCFKFININGKVDGELYLDNFEEIDITSNVSQLNSSIGNNDEFTILHTSDIEDTLLATCNRDKNHSRPMTNNHCIKSLDVAISSEFSEIEEESDLKSVSIFTDDLHSTRDNSLGGPNTTVASFSDQNKLPSFHDSSCKQSLYHVAFQSSEGMFSEIN
ncbi:hypothetical protein PACTADRAFT_33661 [Pachysolen tannophilus NRRL Y-2460]|uniref:Uncharacterized protein n=1 Tax=Pachysolen tannophilus NRRL Y-2460 TaxID=669874 RepID=A0A1E4TXL4_PACTA|nr:hypothetical protein PACTADRAFT_33661 [Pachysolen tannophilus NRRL Y-2460]